MKYKDKLNTYLERTKNKKLTVTNVEHVNETDDYTRFLKVARKCLIGDAALVGAESIIMPLLFSKSDIKLGDVLLITFGYVIIRNNSICHSFLYKRDDKEEDVDKVKCIK